MNEYIKKEDARWAVRETCKNLNYLTPPVSQLTSAIDKMPSADVVEVVRCKDCKWWDGIECKTRDIDVVDEDDFCSYGERKDGDEHECE